jgi:hypothetical protein
MDSLQNCSAGGPVFLTNLVSVLGTNGTATVTFDLWGGTNGVPYDLYAVEKLTGDSVTNWFWNWLGIGYSCNSYTFTNQPAWQSFCFAASPPPKLVPGLRMWLKADADVQMDSPPRVRQWSDQSENADNAVQGTVSSPPL